MADLITLEEYKLFLKKNYTESEEKNEQDVYYSNLLIPSMSLAFQKYFDNDFQSISRTETFSIRNSYTKYIFPRYKPISSITSVTIDDTLQDSDTYKLLADTNAIVLSSALDLAGLVYESYYWPLGHNNVVVVYVGGMAIERGHKYMICALMAKMDKIFSTVAEGEQAIIKELEKPENAMLETTFRNYTI